MKIDTYKLYQVYNSLFLNLSYQNSNTVGYLIPILGKYAKDKLVEGKNPIEILDAFYDNYVGIIKEDKISFMFKVIQYVERQVVLFDSIEDVGAPRGLEDQKALLVQDVFKTTSETTSIEELKEKLNDFSVRIVLTAHPTQFYRPQVLDIIAKLRKQIIKNNIDKIDVLLHQLGLTSLINSKSPTPLDEALNILHMCRYEYYDAIGSFYYKLKNQFPGLDNPDIITLGFWPCGDRDGNPFVTFETTRKVVDALRMTLMKCYYQDIKLLGNKLTFKGIESILSDLRDELYQAMFRADYIVHHEDIIAALQKIKNILINANDSIYLKDLEKLIAKVELFKSHFASLDIRQDHSVHIKTIEYLLTSAGFIENTLEELEEARLSELLTMDYIEIPKESSGDDLIDDTIRNIAQLKQIQQLNGFKGCHRYIISNSEDVFSVLMVLGLFRWIYKSEEIPFDIVPLFETMKGMDACPSVMRTLFQNKTYNKHIESREKRQTMMLGFSDGTKDGGYLKANWSIFKSKEDLTKVCKEFDVEAIFFDGRGGPPARGGGKTHNFYAALGTDIANNEIQLTIQGQTITSTYGTADRFIFNAEQMISSGLLNHVRRETSGISKSDRTLIEQLSELSYEKYLALKNHPMFLPYLEEMTTLKYYSMAKIGSRPSKRNQDKKLTLKDLRAISYVGSWSQLKQNIPGYYGIGTALFKMKEEGKMSACKALYQGVPFFKTLIDNCMMSLTKCFFELTSYIKEHETFSEFWMILHDEYVLSKEMILELTRQQTLMEDEQLTKRSIDTRESIVLPLIVIQNYALQMITNNQDPTNRHLYEKLVMRSLYGNINASRNSA